MKKMFWSLGITSLLIWSTSAQASFNSGSTGALGNYTTTVNRVIALPPDGVLNYGSITIGSGATVTFTPNAANTPVYMLATGDVNIAGTININGTAGGGGGSETAGVGGPGGFNGGFGGPPTYPGGYGLGPGGGGAGGVCQGAGGGFGTAGGNSGTCSYGGGAYGSITLLPMIGGSGGGGSYSSLNCAGGGGGGGGGAIIIASSTLINFTGTITANAGSGGQGWCNWGGGGGSGGGIRLIANIISGNGTITANGGQGGCCGGAAGGSGRIRLEAYTNNRTAGTSPPYSYGLPSSVRPANLPSLSITSVAGATPPANPTGNYNQPDILLPNTTTNPVTVNVSAANIPTGTTATVWVIPQYGTATSANSILTGTQQSSTASVNVNLSTTYSNVVTAQATFTITGMYYNGDEIVKARVATTLGGKSKVVYITKSGNEINGELIAGLAK